MCSYFTNVTYNDEETLETKERLLRYFDAIIPALPSDPEKAPPHIRYFVDIVQRLQRMTPADLGSRSIITGDPEQCLGVLKECEEAGISEVILYFNFGALAHEESLKAMDRVAEHLLPHFEPAF